MYHRKHGHVVGDGTSAYTNVPNSADSGISNGTGSGVSNYPDGVKPGYGYEASKDVNVQQRSGYGYDNTGNTLPQQKSGYNGGYVQPAGTPVSYGPNGMPLETYPVRKKNNKVANRCAAAFIACWACTWPCHGPCCCGL